MWNLIRDGVTDLFDGNGNIINDRVNEIKSHKFKNYKTIRDNNTQDRVRFKCSCGAFVDVVRDLSSRTIKVKYFSYISKGNPDLCNYQIVKDIVE